MNKFSRILHNEIANNFKVHQDVNHFEVFVRYLIKNGLKYDFNRLYSELFDVTYSFKEIIRALKKSNQNRNIDNAYRTALSMLIKGDFTKVIEHDENTVNVLKDVYDMIAVLEDTENVEILKYVRNYEEDIDAIKSFLVSYLKNESHPALDFRLLQRVHSQFKENHPDRFKSFFSKVQELADALGAKDIESVSYRLANDKEAELTKQVINLFNDNKENITSIVNDLKEIKGESFQELYDSLTNKISKQDVVDVCKIFIYYAKKSPALRVIGRFSLPAIANRFEAIEDASFDKLKTIISKTLGDNLKKQLVFETHGDTYYQAIGEFDGAFVEVEEVYEKLHELSNSKNELKEAIVCLNIPTDECAKIEASVVAFLMHVHAGDPEKAIEYYHAHKNDENNVDLLVKTLDMFYSNIEKDADGVTIKLFSNDGDLEKEKMAANLLFYTLSLAKNGFDPGANEIVKQYEELHDSVGADSPDFANMMESKEDTFAASLDEYNPGDYESEVEYFRNALMSGFSKYRQFPSVTLNTNFNTFASKVLSEEDAPEFMKDVLEELSATQISNIISNFTEMLDFYPNFKKYFLIFLMSALERNFSAKELIKQISDDPTEIMKIKRFIEMAAPAEKKEHYLALAGLAEENSEKIS
jgi:hypothetical protein